MWSPVDVVANGRMVEAHGLVDDPFSNIRSPQVNVGQPPDEPIRRILQSPPVKSPRKFLGLVLAPVFEANQLLPEKLDPFGDHVEIIVDSGAAAAKPGDVDFKPSKQKELLGLSQATRDDTPDEKAAWHWQAQAGGTFRQGSSSNTNMSALFLAERHSVRSDLMAKMGAVYNDNGGTDQNRRWFAESLFDKNLRGHWLAYVRDEAEFDEARKIRIRDIFSAGLGFRFIDRLTERWLARTGPTYTYVDYAASANLQDKFQSGWLIESDYRKIITEGVRFEWIATAYPDFINQSALRVRNESAWTFPIGGKKSHWNWKIGAWHEYQSRPAAGANRNDFEAVFSIVYSNNYTVTSLAVPPPIDPAKKDGF